MGCHFLLQCMKVKSEREFAWLCPTLCNPMDCSLPGSSIHGIFQARVLEWGAIAFSHYCIIGPNNIPEKVTETRTQFSISLVPELIYFLLHYPSRGMAHCCFQFYAGQASKGGQRISLVVQWLRLHAPNARSPGSIPGQGTGSHMPQLRLKTHN